MDADVFMLYDVFICIVSVLESNYLEKMTSGFLMSNVVLVNHNNDETDFYDVFDDSNVKLGTKIPVRFFFKMQKYHISTAQFPILH